MHPNVANSPADKLLSVGRIFMSADTDWSVAEVRWRDETGHESDTYGCRWNGDVTDPSSVGHPGRGIYGAWFILPEAFHPIAKLLVEAGGA